MANPHFMNRNAFRAMLDFARSSAVPSPSPQTLRESSVKEERGIFVRDKVVDSEVNSKTNQASKTHPHQTNLKSESAEQDPINLSSDDEPEYPDEHDSPDEHDLWFNVGAAIVDKSMGSAELEAERIKREFSVSSLTSLRRDSVRSSASGGPSLKTPKKFKIVRSQLVFFGHKIGGKVEGAKHNEIIELPRLRSDTFADFRRVLTDQVHGQNTNFARIDNLCLAFLGAAALVDTVFQRNVVERIRARVISLAEVDAANLYKKLLGKVVWAWSVQTEGRMGLQPVLTASLAYICTGYETKVTPKQEAKKGRKRKRSAEEDEDSEEEPVLRLNVVVELTKRLGHLEWFAAEILPCFMSLCTDLVKLNKGRVDGEWEMLGVERLLPNSVPVVLD